MPFVKENVHCWSSRIPNLDLVICGPNPHQSGIRASWLWVRNQPSPLTVWVSSLSLFFVWVICFILRVYLSLICFVSCVYWRREKAKPKQPFSSHSTSPSSAIVHPKRPAASSWQITVQKKKKGDHSPKQISRCK